MTYDDWLTTPPAMESAPDSDDEAEMENGSDECEERYEERDRDEWKHEAAEWQRLK